MSLGSIFASPSYRHFRAARRATCLQKIAVDKGARGSHLSLARRRGLMATQQAPNARAFLRRLHPWIGKAVHARWTVRRSFYQSEVDALLMALDAEPGRRRRATYEPRADQPKRLLRLLGLPHECTAGEFVASWRRFLKAHHPDLNPDQTPDERRHFAEAVALWRR